jgi:hypothetical protein
MTTPPRVTPERATEAVLAIHERHRQIGDPHREEIGYEPADVLDYLRKRGPGLPEGVRVDDLFDAALLHVHLWWRAAERERWLLDTADRLGIARGRFGAIFGMRSRQGFRDRADRLHALLDVTGAGRPDERVGRADRAAAGTSPVGEAAWFTSVREDVLKLAREVDAFYMLVDDETAEDLLEVRRDLGDGICGPGMFAMLAQAVAALVECPVGDVARQAGPLRARLARLQHEREVATGRAVAEQ